MIRKTAVFWEVTPCNMVNIYERTASIFMAKVRRTSKEVPYNGREQALGLYVHTKCLQLQIYIFIYLFIYSEALSSATWTPALKLAG